MTATAVFHPAIVFYLHQLIREADETKDGRYKEDGGNPLEIITRTAAARLAYICTRQRAEIREKETTGAAYALLDWDNSVLKANKTRRFALGNGFWNWIVMVQRIINTQPASRGPSTNLSSIIMTERRARERYINKKKLCQCETIIFRRDLLQSNFSFEKIIPPLVSVSTFPDYIAVGNVNPAIIPRRLSTAARHCVYSFYYHLCAPRFPFAGLHYFLNFFFSASTLFNTK